MTNPLRELSGLGQAVWLDYLHRRILEDGELARLIADDGVTGLTSNPSIFEQAIAGGDTYDSALKAQVLGADDDVMALYEGLAIADIRAAADAFRPVYDSLDRRDGFVSLEVSPYLAMDTEATIAEARRLWRAVDRPNLMIKVPGTGPGVPAIRVLVGEGININVTLLFSRKHYLAAVGAYMRGIERRLAEGLSPAVWSVASLFISRWDVAIKDRVPPALANRLGVAVGMQCYAAYRDVLASPRWQKLAAAGAQPQRLLWASTGAKDPALPDTYLRRSWQDRERLAQRRRQCRDITGRIQA